MKIIQHLKKEKKHLKKLVCGIHQNQTTFELKKKLKNLVCGIHEINTRFEE